MLKLRVCWCRTILLLIYCVLGKMKYTSSPDKLCNQVKVPNTNVMWFVERWNTSGSCKFCINEAIASGDFTSMNRPPSHIHQLKENRWMFILKIGIRIMKIKIPKRIWVMSMIPRIW
ncbi:unnamed protein product [Lactuca virosa]|uniref:Secreted protein n=1 Tax=Lactuca virosa TaxID=75947 RepID=A0AAU9MKH7_9ASTR|nr:unnamed protein product [Lactuca virosa]